MRATLQIGHDSWAVASVIDRYLDVEGDVAPPGDRNEAMVRFSVAADAIAVLGRVEQVASKAPGQTLVKFGPADMAIWQAARASAAAGVLDAPAIVQSSGSGLVDHRAERAARPWLERMVLLVGPPLVFFFMALVVGALLFDRFFVIHVNQAMIEIEKAIVSAPSTGRVLFIARKGTFEAGEPIIGVAKRNGSDTMIDSPCDCIVGQRYVSEGAPVARGDPIISLTQEGAKSMIVVHLPVADLFRIGRDSTARIRYSDGVVTKVPAFQPHFAESSALTSSGTVELRLDPGRSISPTLVGQPVDVSLDALPPLPTSARDVLTLLRVLP